MLPFEPMDPRTLWGSNGEPTIGGLVATALSGPRRISAGAVRDSLIGVKFVNGAGEVISSGGRVMKNVTGLDLVKIQCGAHGTLGLILEATFKLLPRPRHEATIVLAGLDNERAGAAMSRALGSPYRVSGAAMLPEGVGRGVVANLSAPRRVRRFGRLSLRERLQDELAEFGAGQTLTGGESQMLWRAVRDVEFLGRTAQPRDMAHQREAFARRQAHRQSRRNGAGVVARLGRRPRLGRHRAAGGGGGKRARGGGRVARPRDADARADEGCAGALPCSSRRAHSGGRRRKS